MGENSREPKESRKEEQKRRREAASRRKRMQIIIWSAAAAAVLLVAVWFLVRQPSADNEAAQMGYPDLKQVDAGQTPAGFDEKNQPVLGNPSAPVQIVVFSDYKCPYCKMWMDEVLPELRETYIDKGIARVVYVDTAFLGPDSVLAALAGETLFQMNPEYFWKYHHLMTENQGDKSAEWATYEFILSLIKKEMPEVPLDEFQESMTSRKYIRNIKRDLDIADKQGVQGVPGVFVGGVQMEDPSFDEIRKYIEDNSIKN